MERFGIGNRAHRTEDDRFLKGSGQFLDDISFEGTTYAVFVRSPVAHANLGKIDIKSCMSVPGVLAVFTGDDISSSGVKNLPTLAHEWVELKKSDGSPSFNPDRPLLSQGKVRYVGEPIAMVVADSEFAAQDGAERVQVDYQLLDSVVDPETAHEEGRPQLFDENESNTSFTYYAGKIEEANKILDEAPHVVTRHLKNNRVIVNPLEARGAIGIFDNNTQHYLLHCDTQHPYDVRKQTADCLGIDIKKIRVLAPDIGGGFGIKYIAYPEHVLVLWASQKIGKPVKWRSGRSEAFLCDAHARDLAGTASLALDEQGKFLAIKANLNANLGAYSSSHGPVCPTILSTLMMSGGYTMPVVAAEVRGVFTNTVPIDAYRGCGQPEGHYILERLIHAAAGVLGLNQDQIRRKNFVSPSAMPYTSPMEVEFDSGHFEDNLMDALEASNWEGGEKRRSDALARGKLYGIGIASYVEITGADTREGAAIKFEENGKVILNVGTKSSGQGHETVFAQMLHHQLGIPFDKIIVKDGDTNELPHGGGSGGSRSMQMAGTAIYRGSEIVKSKAQELAAHFFEASSSDIKFDQGDYFIIGTDLKINIMDLATMARDSEKLPTGMEAGLDTAVDINHETSTFPNGSHICELEVDPETGSVDVVNYFAVSDYGRVMNPSLLEGQVHGGVAQGIGQALYERTVFGNDGQLSSGSFIDYCMPRAGDLPSYFVGFNEVLCTTNPLGVKGAGESGCIASLPAVMNALHNALECKGVSHIDMPATPERVWRAIQDARI
ncbi:MAG: carbon monoxide dehydrogenase [Alphaproteobacteria bacterium]|nr:carbon monoxide dehydrogenase [Alphaproteobacteria bacterium]|tara:strand:+ start:733 stop:3066 length:2334 start_codon:yes stop_codon:yes gene_type:complete